MTVVKAIIPINAFIGAISERGIKVRFSLYGHCAELHDSITQHPGGFEKSIFPGENKRMGEPVNG